MEKTEVVEEVVKPSVKQPTKKARVKNLSIAQFDNDKGRSYRLQKGFKRKGSDEWEYYNMDLFENELDVVLDLIKQIKA